MPAATFAGDRGRVAAPSAGRRRRLPVAPFAESCRRVVAVVFAGDRRVWRAAGLCAVPLVLLICAYCVAPRAYYTGTDNVEVYTYIAPAPAGARVCVPGLQIPAGTASLRLQLISRTTERPALHLTLREGASTLSSVLGPTAVAADRISAAIFSIPGLAARPAYAGASVCLTAGDLVNWGGTPLPQTPSQAPTLQGSPLPARIALWYLPPAGARSSYLARAGAILSRASLFRAGLVGPWLYVLLLLGVLPALALASIRCLAVAARRQLSLPLRRWAWLGGARQASARRARGGWDGGGRGRDGSHGGSRARCSRSPRSTSPAGRSSPPPSKRPTRSTTSPTRSRSSNAGRRRRATPARRWRGGRARRTSRSKTRASSPTTRWATRSCRGPRCRNATTGRRWRRSTRAAPTAAATRRRRPTARSTTRRSPPPTSPRAPRRSRS